MPRQLPRTKTPKQQLIIKAVEDFCGDDGSTSRNIVNSALWVMGRKKRIELTDEEKKIVFYVQANIADPIYCKSLS